mmetsp:Transcript_1881/g.4104  ORF Transcript_1881/g.4104 Transcript_1881/m.4104 type:complete len:236 (+) Transcript_1881:1146-1853(+)
MAPCRSDGAFCTKALSFAASSIDFTSPSSSARAAVRAFSSSALIWERWSHSLARVSQRSVRSFMYSWSSFSMAWAETRSSRLEAMLLARESMSMASWSMDALFVFMWVVSESTISLWTWVLLPNSSSTSAFLATNSALTSSITLMMLSEWNLYTGSLGSTEASACRKAATSLWPFVPGFKKPRTSAISSVFRTDGRIAKNEAGLDFSIAAMADERPVIAWLSSAAVFSYSAFSFA